VSNDLRISCGPPGRSAHNLTFRSTLKARCGRAEFRARQARRLHARVRRCRSRARELLWVFGLGAQARPCWTCQDESENWRICVVD
jgi:hypothetical protein